MSSTTFLQSTFKGNAENNFERSNVSEYKVLNKIGEGSFSEVLKCRDNNSGEYYAAKRLKKRFDSLEDVFGCAEIIAMQKISRHPNILYMLEFHFDPAIGKVTFLFELMDMSLYDFMKVRKKSIPEIRAKNYLYQILNGIEHIHKNGLFHRDIKPENILIKIPLDPRASHLKCEIVKIADLGSIRGIYSKPPYTEYISTRWYRSPECLLTSGYYGPKMDIWAAGCVFYEILTLKPLFPGYNEVDQLERIHNILGTPNHRTITKFLPHKSCNYDSFPKRTGSGLMPLLSHISNDGQDILKLMLVYDPDHRSNVKRLIDHRYFYPFREHKSRQFRRSSSTEPRGAKTVGDWRSNTNTKIPRPPGHDKYITTVNRASQNDVISTKRTSGSLMSDKNKKLEEVSNANNKPVPKYNEIVKSLKPLHKKIVQDNDTYRKTTSNIPTLTTKAADYTNQYSKSFVISRAPTKRLEPIFESKNELMLPKPSKIRNIESKKKKIL